MGKIRVGLYLGEDAVDKLKQQDNMSRYVERLILGENGLDIDLSVEKISIMFGNGEKNLVDNNVKNSIMSLLEDE